MKTRREFMRFTLGAVACLGAAIVAPKVLVAKEKKKQIPVLSKGYYFDRNGDYVTSGYAQIIPQTGTVHHGDVTITVASTDGFKSGNAWSVISND